NVLQTGPTLMISDLFDFSVYVDARVETIEKWYINRFLGLRHTAFREPGAHFAAYADMNDEQAFNQAREIWQSINLPNLAENTLPTRVRASSVLRKGEDHTVEKVRMRKLSPSPFAQATTGSSSFKSTRSMSFLNESIMDWSLSLRRARGFSFKS